VMAPPSLSDKLSRRLVRSPSWRRPGLTRSSCRSATRPVTGVTSMPRTGARTTTRSAGGAHDRPTQLRRPCPAHCPAIEAVLPGWSGRDWLVALPFPVSNQRVVALLNTGRRGLGVPSLNRGTMRCTDYCD
jgi:hypothetical protein